MKTNIKLHAWGVRGSAPRSGQRFREYGGNTSCWSLELEAEKRMIVFDAGTGIIDLNDYLKDRDIKRIDIFISHIHLDHINGLFLLSPLYYDSCEINIYGENTESLVEMFAPPLWPVTAKNFGGNVTWYSLKAGQVCEIGDSITVETLKGNHPGGSLLYRVNAAGKAVVYGLDCEIDADMKERYIAFAQSADAIIYDASYDEETREHKIGWGHSSFEEGVEIKRLAGAKKIIMAHYSSDYDDEALKKLEERCRAMDSDAVYAKETMETEV